MVDPLGTDVSPSPVDFGLKHSRIKRTLSRSIFIEREASMFTKRLVMLILTAIECNRRQVVKRLHEHVYWHNARMVVVLDDFAVVSPMPNVDRVDQQTAQGGS